MMRRSIRHGGREILSNRKASAASASTAASWAVLLLALLATGAFAAKTTHPRPALSPYEQAEQSRQGLESRPEDQRTRHDYERTLSLYRAVYHDDPASSKADASIYAVAELLAEQGRLFQDDKSLHDALGQYDFLRREYPSSHYRADALLAQAEIQLRDLSDLPAAKATLQSFMKQYSHSPQTARARKQLKEILSEESIAKFPQSKAVQRRVPSQTTSSTTLPSAPPSTPLTTSYPSRSQASYPSHSPLALSSRRATPPPATVAPSPSSPIFPWNASLGALPVTKPARTHIEGGPASPQAPTSEHATVPPPPILQPATVTDSSRAKGKGRLVSVTGVRHWSTPIYTRVAIDLSDEVQYEAARVPDPDRIFFDLHSARLTAELIGKSVTVTDDGFLKRIRAAQFSNDVTRIVLDVSDVSDYSAFLLPNPYRLIIDIHGRKSGSTTLRQAALPSPSAALVGVSPQQSSSGAPGITASTLPIPNGGSSKAPTTISRKSVTVSATTIADPAQASSTDQSASQEIASLGHQPDRIRATSHPTSAPIAASVAGATPAAQPDLTKTKAPVSRDQTHRKTNPDYVALGDTTPSAIHEADPTAAGGRSMVRALGLKIGRIVVDAGHGGHDSGTLGPEGIEEKDIVLDVALRLGKLLKQRLGADVIFTRSDDTFIPLETRTAIANKAQADLFVSVHANSSSDSNARGVETYYLNFTSSPESLELAARENAVSEQSIHQLSDLVKKITLHDKIDESRELASDVERYLYQGLEEGNPGLRDRGVKQAPFVVLIGANMPSILAEISFLTNRDDARQLRDPAYRQRIAESLYRGVARYVGGLSGVRLAENSTRFPVH